MIYIVRGALCGALLILGMVLVAISRDLAARPTDQATCLRQAIAPYQKARCLRVPQ